MLSAMARSEQPNPATPPLLALVGSEESTGDLAADVEKLGLRILRCPVIRAEAPAAWDALAAALHEAAPWDWTAFTSGYAARFFFRGLRALGMVDGGAPAHTAIASIGPGTSEALRELGCAPELEASVNSGGGLARDMIARGVAGKRVLLPRSDIARPELPALLREAGAEVCEVVVYRTLTDHAGVAALTAALGGGAVRGIVLTSPSTVSSVMESLRGQAALLLQNVALFSIGPSTSARLRECGAKVCAEAAPHNAAGLLAALAAWRVESSQ